MLINKATDGFAPWRARPRILGEPLRYRPIRFSLAFNRSIRCYGRTKRCAGVFFEVHPEVSFTVMYGDKPIPEPKKVNRRVHALGMRCRKELLAGQDFASGFLEAKPPLGAALDDFYDACACAWSGARILRQEERIFPPEPGIDAKGLQVAIRA